MIFLNTILFRISHFKGCNDLHGYSDRFSSKMFFMFRCSYYLWRVFSCCHTIYFCFSCKMFLQDISRGYFTVWSPYRTEWTYAEDSCNEDYKGVETGCLYFSNGCVYRRFWDLFFLRWIDDRCCIFYNFCLSHY